MRETITRQPRDQLTEELADLYAVKLALILVPIRQVLHIADRQELADTMKRLVVSFSADLDAVLTPYEITRKD